MLPNYHDRLHFKLLLGEVSLCFSSSRCETLLGKEVRKMRE